VPAITHRFLLFFCFAKALFIFVSCQTNEVPAETPLPTNVSVQENEIQSAVPRGGGIVEEIRSNTETGSPSSLLKSLEIIRNRELGATEFGRVMNTVNVTLLKTIYPAIRAQMPPLNPPITHSYSRILREAEKGVYLAPLQNSTDYLEYVLPFLAYYPGGNLDSAWPQRGGGNTISPETYLSTLPNLEKAKKLNAESVLADYFTGIAYEYSGRLIEADAQYSRVWEKFPECFPAALGIVRVLEAQGQKQESLRFLSELVLDFPDNTQVKRQLALAYYRSGDWSRAEAAVDEILQKDSRDGEFVLMKAHILVHKGQLLQAQVPLDIYSGISPSNKLYLFLRARLQMEVYLNRDAALNYLRSILRSPLPQDAIDEEAAIYASRILMESSRPQDLNEGRELLAKLLAVPVPSLEVVSLALSDAINRDDWREAQAYLSRLLEERRSLQDLLAAYTMEREQGNKAAALSYARELYERNRDFEDGNIAYVTALIDLGRTGEAARIIENRLGNVTWGGFKSRYFYLRSQTRANEESKMTDLRASLFEDPRNLDAIVALFEIFHRRKDERRAVYYLKQGLALAPDDQRLKRYETEYAAAMGGIF
jgi:tetratricopeptide (TPR) repeat protein